MSARELAKLLHFGMVRYRKYVQFPVPRELFADLDRDLDVLCDAACDHWFKPEPPELVAAWRKRIDKHCEAPKKYMKTR